MLCGRERLDVAVLPSVCSNQALDIFRNAEDYPEGASGDKLGGEWNFELFLCGLFVVYRTTIPYCKFCIFSSVIFVETSLFQTRQ